MVAITHPAAFPVRRSHPLSVYRRRRLALAGAVLVALALASVLLDAVAGARGAHDGVRPVAEVAVVVEPGDTVWSIAAEVAPGADPRPVVDAIVEANGGSSLVAGQRLVLALP
jgi:hypothetical protein